MALPPSRLDKAIVLEPGGKERVMKRMADLGTPISEDCFFDVSQEEIKTHEGRGMLFGMNLREAAGLPKDTAAIVATDGSMTVVKLK